ncbi:MAG: ABC transporter ATP-binding protein [Oscillospiraceae bacterium]|nr:ABC transporter ATP-binding protein [Oscillospiraceae bacterium]
MMKLKRYAKPFTAIMLMALVMLFGQALIELNLPNYMSKIVNIGLQQGGIDSAVPEVISTEGLSLLSTFMTEQDRQLVEQSYDKISAGNVKDEKLAKKYPNLKTVDAAVLNTSDKAQMALLEDIFGRSMYSFMSLAQQMAEQNENATVADGNSKSIDITKVYPMASMMQMLPQEQLQRVITEAQGKEADTLKQTAVVLVKAFYTELGADTAHIQTMSILKTGGIMLLLSLLGVIFAASVGFFASRAGAGIAHDLRADVFKKVTGFTNTEFDKFSTASLITRTTNDITQIQQFVTMGLRMMCFAPVMGIGGLYMAIKKSPNMSWILGLAVALVLILIITMFKIAMPRFKIMQNLIDKLNLVTRENLSGMMVIRAFSTQKHEEKRFDKANVDLTQNSLFVNRAMATMMPCMMFIMNGIMLLIVWAGAHQIEQSTMQVGDMMAFMQYAMEVIMSFLFISMMFIMIPRASVSAERIYEVLSTQDSIEDPVAPQEIANTDGTVCFNDVSFKYAGADEDVLQHISFTAKPGQTTAFIGSTGSGKSTLINLIPRFYDATAGNITVGGVDVRNMTQHDLRSKIGYVPQKGVLFSGDIDSNLRYGAEDANQEQIRKAAEVAQALSFIEEKPEGFETEISQGGTNVSGGQRQRLSIARALAKNAPVYIFDDSFSALDFKTDATLRRALKKYTENATVLIVAQRISTIMNAEQIIVLSEGKIVGMGTHKQLLQSCQNYREIAQSQLSKEELEA